MGQRLAVSCVLLLACGCGSHQASAGGATGAAGAPALGGAPAVGAGGTASGGSASGAPSALAGAPTMATAGAGGQSAAGAAGAAAGGTPGAADAGTNAGGGANAGNANTGGSAGAGGARALDATCGGMNASAMNLKDKYAGCFPIGAAVDAQSYMTHAPLLKAHFNSVTAENDMKFDALEPNENSFSYAAADKIVDFARSNNMKIRGHTLVWYNQNPAWVFSNGSGGTVSKDTLLGRMKNHIKNVVQHYQGKLYAWDVVNEAIMEDGSYRSGTLADDKKSRWYEIIGPSYIAEAFRAAHDADPNAKLFYNDYYDYIPAKQQGIYNMLKGLLADGVPVHGVGMQCHLNIEPSTKMDNQAYYQSVENLEKAIELYSSLGLEVQVTELDVSLYVPGVSYDQSTYYTAATFTDALEAQQASRYQAFFQLLRRHRDVISGVTLWGIADDNTWLSEFSSGRKDFPLLFDTNHQPKKAFDAVMNF
ncbi:MAG TPA: endo-1,4-beta-xylanase [Polyangiaceae bacterium]|nr:endo-1,4-beta-xylanase [Polyangiaceae bacterium]